MRRFARVLHQHSTIHHYSTTSWKNLGPKGKSNHHDDRLRWTVCQKTGNHIGSVFDVVNNMEKKMGFQYTISFIESLRDVTIDKELKSVIIRSMDDAAEAEKYNRPWTDFKKPYILLKGLLGNGISVNENTYGPILSYMIKKRMTKDFVLLINDLMMNNIDSSSRLSYYQMLMWIKEEAEEKIMELIKNTNCSTREHYLEALGESGREKEITILLDAIDVQRVSTETTERTFRLLGHFGLVSHAKKLIRKFQTMDTDYDEKYVSKLICIYAMNLPSQLENAVRILKGLHRELMATTTQATYERVIKTCTDRKEISLALDVVEIMFKEGLIIDVNLLNTILVTCHYSGYHIWVRRVYSMIEYTKPNEKTLEKMINLFMKINDYAAAKKLLHDSRGFNVSPTTEMYNVILGGFFEKEEFKKGWKFLDEMDDLSVKRNSKTYECIISACNTEDDIVKYDREMQLSGVQPTKGNFEALIKAWARCRSFVNAKKVLLDKSVPAKSLNDLRNTLASTLAHYGQMADAYAEYEEIKRSKQLVKPRTIQMLIQHTHAPNQHDRLIDLLGQVCKYEDWDYSCASIVMYCVEHNLLEEALSLLSARVKRWPKEKKLLIGNIFDEMSQLIVNKLHSNKCDNASLHFGVVLFTKIMREIKVSPSRRSLDFMLHACYLRRHLKYLLDIWKMCKESCRRYYMIDHLCMYKALLACGEPEKAKLLIKHISGDEIDEDIDWIRKECEHYNWKPIGF